jgi:hypothetical protein
MPIEACDEFVFAKWFFQGRRRAKLLSDAQKIDIEGFSAPRYRDDRDVRVEAAYLTYRFDAFFIRHDDVGDDGVDRLLVELSEAATAVFRLDDLVPGRLQHSTDRPAHRGFILDNQDSHYFVSKGSSCFSRRERELSSLGASRRAETAPRP